MKISASESCPPKGKLLVFTYVLLFFCLFCSCDSKISDDYNNKYLNDNDFRYSEISFVFDECFSKNGFVIPVNINGALFNVLVDTGHIGNLILNENSLKQSSIDSNSIIPETSQVGTMGGFGKIKSAVVNIGPYTFNNRVIGVTRKLFLGDDIDGLIGFQYLKYFQVRFDGFSRSLALSIDARNADETFKPYQSIKNYPIIDVRIGNQTYKAVWDSGNRNAFFLTNFNTQQSIRKLYPNLPIYETKGNWVSDYKAESAGVHAFLFVPELDLNGFLLKDVKIISTDWGIPHLLINFNFGIDLCKIFMISINYPKEEISISKISDKRLNTQNNPPEMIVGWDKKIYSIIYYSNKQNILGIGDEIIDGFYSFAKLYQGSNHGVVDLKLKRKDGSMYSYKYEHIAHENR